MTRLRFFRIVVALLVSLVSVSALAVPSEKDEKKGRDLAATAFDLYQKEKYAEALAKFQEAEKIYPAAQVLRLEGYTLLAMKRYIEAAEILERAMKTDYKPLAPADAEETEDYLKEAMKNVASVTFRSDVIDAKGSIDGAAAKPLPLTVKLTPGPHHVVVEAPDHDTVDVNPEIAAGTSTLTFNPKARDAGKPKVDPLKDKVEDPKPEPKKSPFGWFAGQREVGIAIAGAGLVASGVGLGLGIYGLKLNSAVQTNIDAHQAQYDPSCSTHSELCQGDISLINSDGARAAKLRNAGMGTGIAGAGLFAVGLTFFLMSGDGPLAPKDGKDKATAPPAARVACGPTGLAVTCLGSF